VYQCGSIAASAAKRGVASQRETGPKAIGGQTRRRRGPAGKVRAKCLGAKCLKLAIVVPAEPILRGRKNLFQLALTASACVHVLCGDTAGTHRQHTWRTGNPVSAEHLRQVALVGTRAAPARRLQPQPQPLAARSQDCAQTTTRQGSCQVSAKRWRRLTIPIAGRHCRAHRKC
jgi:hypothetical protein